MKKSGPDRKYTQEFRLAAVKLIRSPENGHHEVYYLDLVEDV
jgi:transposase-like protein